MGGWGIDGVEICILMEDRCVGLLLRRLKDESKC
jgi:hypothetical protein